MDAENLKTGWTIRKTTSDKATGWRGYAFTLYAKDEKTVVVELRARTARALWNKITKFLKGVQ